MKITYEFVTGEVSEAEVDERLGGMLLDLDRQQYNNDQKETRRHFSLDGMDYEGELFASAEDTEGEAVRREDMARLSASLDALSPLKVLGRGYAIAQRADGRAVVSAGDVAPDDLLKLTLADGSVDCRVL